MGIPIAVASLVMQEAERRAFSGSLLTLGKQDVLFDGEALEAAARRFGLELDPEVMPRISAKPHLADRGFIDDVTLFRALGCSNVSSVDASNFEGADFLLDLNADETPQELVGRFDTIGICMVDSIVM